MFVIIKSIVLEIKNIQSFIFCTDPQGSLAVLKYDVDRIITDTIRIFGIVHIGMKNIVLPVIIVQPSILGSYPEPPLWIFEYILNMIIGYTGGVRWVVEKLSKRFFFFIEQVQPIQAAYPEVVIAIVQ